MDAIRGFEDILKPWIELDSLLAIKAATDHPRQQEDTRVPRAVRDRRSSEQAPGESETNMPEGGGRTRPDHTIKEFH